MGVHIEINGLPKFKTVRMVHVNIVYWISLFKAMNKQVGLLTKTHFLKNGHVQNDGNVYSLEKKTAGSSTAIK